MADSFYKSLLDDLYDAVYFVDRDRRITYWNHAAEKLTGFRQEDVIGTLCSDKKLNHVNDQGESLCSTMCPLAQSIQDGQPREADVYFHHKLGHRVPCSVRVSPIRNRQGDIIGGVEIFGDNSMKVIALQRVVDVEKVAYLDHLTGLANRRYVTSFIEGKLAEMSRYGWAFGVLFMDIDWFKRVNDTYGHDAGDQVLLVVANTLRSNARSLDLIGRWGGDEFVVVVTAEPAQIGHLANRLRLLIENSSVPLGVNTLHATVSAGATPALSADSVDSVIKRADALMYRSKAEGRNRVTVESRDWRMSMRYLEVRRHTIRSKPGNHLSPEGIGRAKRVAETAGPFARVVTSSVSRAYETAVAMGLAVDELDERLGTMGNDVDIELPWPFGFAEAAAAVSRGGAAARFAAEQAALWRSIVASVPDGRSALIITHGGIVELGAVGCMPHADHAAWGAYCDCLEGIRLAFDGQDFVAAKVLRVE